MLKRCQDGEVDCERQVQSPLNVGCTKDVKMLFRQVEAEFVKSKLGVWCESRLTRDNLSLKENGEQREERESHGRRKNLKDLAGR